MKKKVHIIEVLWQMDQKYLKDYSDAYVKGKVQVKTKSITGLHDRKNGVRDVKCFQNSVDKDDIKYFGIQEI